METGTCPVCTEVAILIGRSNDYPGLYKWECTNCSEDFYTERCWGKEIKFARMWMIKKCTCKHEDQDQMHGKGNRVHNPTKEDRSTPSKWRCTVCKNVRD